MDLFLISMPIGDMTQPYTAMPSLAGHLRPRGFDVEQRDYGVEFAHYWSRPGHIERLWADLLAAVEEIEQDGIGQAGWEDYVDLRLLCEQLKPVIGSFMECLLELRSKSIIDDLGLLSRRLRLLTNFQTLLGICERRGMPRPTSFQALSRAEAMTALDAPPFVYESFIADRLVPDMVAAQPLMVGISITYPRQLFPSLLACAALRKALPQTKIVLGGAYLSTIIETFFERREIHGLWDYIIEGEGETALLKLLESGGKLVQLSQVPNLVYQRAGMVLRSAERHEEDIHALNTPDYRGLNIRSYLAPQTVFLLPVARGCYMRCTFCSISYATRGYRTRTGPEIAQDIRRVQSHFGPGEAVNFNFSIDVMAPKHIKEMSQAIGEAGLDIVWDAELRFDNTLSSEIIGMMKRAGCRHIRFGLESAVDRVRELMDKRIRMNRVSEILDDCRREDIKTSAMVIIGFPGETEDEARQTFQFLFDNSHRIRFFALNIFSVSRGSIIAAHPENFDVDLTARDDRFVQPSWDFKIRSGITTEQARELHSEFKAKLIEKYPLADEGFSVGIGGAFTFLTTAHWTWNDLALQDGAATGGDATLAVGAHSVPMLSPRIEKFVARWAYDGSEPLRTDDEILYLATPNYSLLKIEGEAIKVLSSIDGTRSIREITNEVFADDSDDAVSEVCDFLESLRDSKVLGF